ncbi:hypothetical protein MtrunA17_Chr4g0020871 [Medicago truncatula]|uniref:Transmembrane protein n=1 Tax=Medicago truncatula TaxID=3880 RepID=I3SJ42_MEDTR|nr:unknown [Medicago truncatula]RHN60041.1 hypothetical protein MtrunA17_Chr4g0020871 [Medicago truncatula]
MHFTFPLRYMFELLPFSLSLLCFYLQSQTCREIVPFFTLKLVLLSK